MTALILASDRVSRSQLASNAGSAKSLPQVSPAISLAVPRRSWACPGNRRTSTRVPSASVNAMILVVMPPRERPMAWL